VPVTLLLLLHGIGWLRPLPALLWLLDLLLRGLLLRRLLLLLHAFIIVVALLFKQAVLDLQ
jgi:hypothetical protein